MHSAWASGDAAPLAEPELVDDDVDVVVVSCATPGRAEPALHAVVRTAPHATLATTTADRPRSAHRAGLARWAWGERRNMSMLVFLLGRSVVLVVRQQR
jgi:hypothetical protein